MRHTLISTALRFAAPMLPSLSAYIYPTLSGTALKINLRQCLGSGILTPTPTESSSSSSGDCRKVNELKVLLLRPAIRTNSFAFRNKNKNKGRAQKLITISTGTLISRRCGPEKITHSCLFRLAACHLICISVILILHFFLRRFFYSTLNYEKSQIS